MSLVSLALARPKLDFWIIFTYLHKKLGTLTIVYTVKPLAQTCYLLSYLILSQLKCRIDLESSDLKFRLNCVTKSPWNHVLKFLLILIIFYDNLRMLNIFSGLLTASKFSMFLHLGIYRFCSVILNFRKSPKLVIICGLGRKFSLFEVFSWNRTRDVSFHISGLNN